MNIPILALAVFLIPTPVDTGVKAKAKRLDALLPSVRSVPKCEAEHKQLEFPKTQS